MTILHFTFNLYVRRHAADFPLLATYALRPLPPAPLPEPLRAEVDMLTMRFLGDRNAFGDDVEAADDLRRAALPDTWELDRAFLLMLDTKLRVVLMQLDEMRVDTSKDVDEFLEVRQRRGGASGNRKIAGATAGNVGLTRQAPRVMAMGGGKMVC